MTTDLSPLQKARLSYLPKKPKILADLKHISFSQKALASVSEQLKPLFPHTFDQPLIQAVPGKARSSRPLNIGVVFSGGQAPGGHNVIAGIFDALHELSSGSRLFGFLDGPSGIINGKMRELTREGIASFRNQGGFDLIGSGRTKIETDADLAASLATTNKNQLDGIVIIGGDDSNTTAALLAEYFLSQGCKTKVVGVPKTIDGDLQNEWVSISFGFDTATKTYSEMIGNIEKDCLSAKKYTHFIKLMGRSASHISLECALSVHPNLALIGEEIAAQKKTLKEITADIADLIFKRSEMKKNYGVILIPEGVVEFIPEIKLLIQELNKTTDPTSLSPTAKITFQELPAKIQKQLLLERDPHGNIQLSSIETELLLIELVEKELAVRNFTGKFSPLHHFFGYEGRSGLPSNFDCNYCYALGMAAALLLDEGASGYMAFIGNLKSPPSEWTLGGIPLVSLLHFETRKGTLKPVIKKALVDLQGPAFHTFKEKRDGWRLEDRYSNPGPIQFFGDERLTDSIPLILNSQPA